MSVWGEIRKKSLGQELRIEDSASLTKSQKSLLQKIENLKSPFNGISKLKDLRFLTGVTVVVSDRANLDKVLDDSIKKLKDQLERYRKESNYQAIIRQIERKYNILEWAKEQKGKNTLLGLYSRKLLWFDNSSPTVYLFADNINDYAAVNKVNVDNVFGYVFIHEMMHAYFDSFNTNGFPSWETLEEAFAEFGMLTFLNANNSNLPADLLVDAIAHVKSKIVSGPSEYGFGYDLYDITKGGDPQMINRYREISNWIDQMIIWRWAGSNKYFSDIRQYPKHVAAKKCFDGVKDILDYPWTEPNLFIQHSIRKPCPIPRLEKSIQWALTATQTGWCYQCPLIHKDDLMDLLAEVVKVMKNEGVESYLSIVGDDLVFLGKPFSRHASAPAKSRVIPESLCVRGTKVFPAFDSPAHGFAGQVGRVLHALSILFDGLFTLVHENADYTLYGPCTCVPLFSAGSTVSPVPSGTGGSKKYEIIDKTSSTVIAKKIGMPQTALFIVSDYCSRNPGISLADLQRIFASVPHHSSSRMNIVESDVNVKSYIVSHPGDTQGPRYIVRNPITLSTGEVVMVTNQWAGTGKKANFGVFRTVVDGLGYIIK